MMVVPVLIREYIIDHVVHMVSSGYGFIKAGFQGALLNTPFYKCQWQEMY